LNSQPLNAEWPAGNIVGALYHKL